jgi:hypothetical protein
MADQVLRNPRHERFAQELATGKTADLAYVLAGYRENRSNAARLNASQNIQERVAEIQSMGAERAAISVETLIAEAEAARSKATGAVWRGMNVLWFALGHPRYSFAFITGLMGMARIAI